MTRNLLTRLRDLPVPEPSVSLRDRILASRAAGERVALPPAQEKRSRLAIPVAAAAAVVLIAVLGRRSSSEDEPFIFAGSPFWPTSGFGQEPPRAQDTVGRAKYALLDQVSSHVLHPGAWSYAASMTTDGIVTTAQGVREFTITPISRDGIPAFAIVTHGTGRYTPERFADSLYVTREGLRVLRRAIRYGAHPSGHDFPPPSRALSWRDADINWVGSVYRALFQLTSLDKSWRGSVYVRWFPQADQIMLIPIDLRVRGSERVTVPAGTYDTWVVAAGFRNQEARIYVAKDRGWVVKIAMPMGEDAVWEQVLTAQRPA